MTLVVIATHPVQYHAPVYQRLTAQHGVAVHAIYGSDFSVRGALDTEFGTHVKWDTDLLSGYSSAFLGNEAEPPETLSSRALAKALRAAKPSAVLLSGYATRFHQKAAATAFALRYPVVFRAETTDHAVTRDRGRTWLRDGALRAFYRRCDALCPIGTRSRAHYTRLGVPDAKLFDAPYCVNTAPFDLDLAHKADHRRRVREALGIPAEAVVLLYSGKLSERKGIDDLLTAAETLPPHVHLLFMGEGERRGRIEASNKGAVKDRCHLVGFKNQTAMSPYFHAADALVLPSRSAETWGLVVNEGLHHGIPIVASDRVGSVPDLVIPGRTGEVSRAGDAASLRAALERLLAWLGQSQLGQSQLTHTCITHVERFSIEAAARGLEGAYRYAIRAH